MTDQRWCDVHQRWCSSDTARAGLLDEQQPVAAARPSKNFALPPFRRFNHNVVVTWLMTVAHCADTCPGACVLYVLEAQGCLPRGPTHCTYAVLYQPRACRTYSVPCGTPGGARVGRLDLVEHGARLVRVRAHGQDGLAQHVRRLRRGRAGA